ncbi:hypothetical protein G6F57_016150 [Rhizopus arrhizus]|nr:hypothetical protein G6F57_016150 [Rhizopus arrhizus]
MRYARPGKGSGLAVVRAAGVQPQLIDSPSVPESLQIDQQRQRDEHRGTAVTGCGQDVDDRQRQLSALLNAVQPARGTQAHGVACFGVQTARGVGAQNGLAAAQVNSGLHQGIAHAGRNDFGVLDERRAAAEQVGLRVQRAGHADGKAHVFALVQLFDPGGAEIAAGKHLHLKRRGILSQRLLQLTDDAELQAKQQQQRGDDRDKRSHDAKRYFAVVPEVAERQAAQEGKACRHVRPPGRMRCGQAETRQ